MKKKSFIAASAAAVVVLAALAASSFWSFASQMRAFASAPCASADAVVVLTGGKNRAEEGLKLLRGGNTKVLILSGVNKDADMDAIFLNMLTAEERKKIILEKESTSTYQNAVEVRAIMSRLKLDSMLLLTSVYHMPRAGYIFGKIMPSGVRILPCSVATPNFDTEKWWAGDSLFILLAEFVKYRLFVAGFYLGVI